MKVYLPFLTPFFLARRNMLARLGRTLLTLLGIILGVTVVLAIQTTNQSTLDSIRRTFDRTVGQANLMVVPGDRTGRGLDTEVLYQVEDEDGIQAAAPSIRVQTLLASDAPSWEIAFSLNGLAAGNLMALYGIDPALDPQVRVYKLTSGRMPEEEAYETVIPQEFAREKGLAVGDDLVILVPGGTARLRITGLLAEEGVALINDGVVAFTPLGPVQELFNTGGEFDEIALRVDEGLGEDPQDLERYKENLNEVVGENGEVIYPAGRGKLVSQMIATYQLGLTFFSVIAVFVGAFLIYNTFSMTIVERTREIGMLRAIGSSRSTIMAMVLAEAGILSILGSGLGIGAGLLLARGLTALLGNIVSSGRGYLGLTWETLLQSIGVGILVTMGAALFPSIQAARITPIKAMRVRSRTKERIQPTFWMAGLALIFVGWGALFQMKWRPEVLFPIGTTTILMMLLGATLTVALAVALLERLTRPLAFAMYGNEGRLGSSNVRRSVWRTTLTVASLMVALTMIISIDSLAYSFERDLTGWIDSALGGDLYVRSPVTMRTSFASQLVNIPGVEAVTPARIIQVRAAPRSVPAGVSDDVFIFNALELATYRQVSDVEFAANQGDPESNWEKLVQGEAIFISYAVTDRYNLKKGDTITLLTRRGEHAFEIAAEVVDFTGQGQMIYGTYSDLERWFGESGADRFTVKVAPGYTVEEVGQEIEARYRDRRHISVQTTQDFKTSVLGLMNTSFRLFDVLSLIGVIIGGLGVINTLTMNVIERRREIGALRSLGMTQGQVVRMVLAEALAMGVMGGIYGLTFGYVTAHVLIRGVNLLIGYDLEYIFQPRPFLIGIIIALVIVQMAALYPGRRAAGVNIVEAIKHE